MTIPPASSRDPRASASPNKYQSPARNGRCLALDRRAPRHTGGNHAQRFPFGTYQMRLLHGAPVEPSPKPTALVTAPGPLLCDVQAQLEAIGGATAREQLRPQTFQLLDEVRAAIADEAAQLCEHAELDFEQESPPPSRLRASAAQTQRPAVLTRHRFSRDPTEVETGSARRLVVLRDRRRGRPPGNGRHGADPPG